MVGGRVRVFERNAVEGDRVLTILEAAEKGFALPEADSIWVEAEGAGRQIHDLRKVRDRGNKILDEDGADLRSRGGCIESITRRRGLGRKGDRLLYGDRLRNRIDIKRDRQILRSDSGDLDSAATIQCKSRRRRFDRVGPG